MPSPGTVGMRGPARTIRGPGRAFVVAVSLSTVACLLPARFLGAWSSDVAALVWLPLRPGEYLLTSLRHFLRPDSQAAPSGDVQLLTEERDRFRAMWHAERLRAEDLERRLAQFDRTGELDRGGSQVDPMLVLVVGTGAGPGGRFLTLSAGSVQGVTAGDPAVVGGDQLVGRVMGEPSTVTCWMAPITDAAVGRLDVYVAPADRPEAAPSESVRAQLRPDGRGLLVGELDAPRRVGQGDVVRLDDRQWKRAAQGMRVGIVRAVRRADRNPLRAVIEVEPGIDIARLRQVTLKLEPSP